MRYRVVPVPFPFDDLSGQKVRPAVCLTNAVGTHRHVVIAFITSTVPTMLEPTDILLPPGTPDFAATGLRVRSTLRLHRRLLPSLDGSSRTLVPKDSAGASPYRRATFQTRA